MSIEATLERVSAIRQALANPASMIGSDGALTGGTEAPAATSGTSFADALRQAGETSSAPSAALLAQESAGSAGLPGASAIAAPYSLASLNGVAGASLPGAGATSPSRLVAIAETQLGQTEQPPGSNEGAAIAQYRGATAGAMPGEPWCAYFASWAANQAGEPLGAQGQGLGSVSEIWSWAQSTGRAVTNGPGVVPKPGDLIVFGGEHVGIVRDVLANGQIQTIEGNYENKVAANVRSASEATGYVRMS